MSSFSKTFSLFLIFYFLLLSWQPCQDFAAATQPNFANRNEKAITASSGEENEKDDCSPFCACSCCRVSIISYHFSLPENQELPVKTKTFLPDFYENPYLENDLNGIWRPPRV